MKRSRNTLSKTKPRLSNHNNRRRAMKKSTASIISARHNIYRLRIQEEMDDKEKPEQEQEQEQNPQWQR